MQITEQAASEKEGADMDRIILHCDCNGYFASVECIERPELRDVPMAVCGNPESRHGIILAKNELAKKFGIQTAETVWQAKKKCPQLTLVPPHHDRYQYYCRLINRIYGEYTDQVEAFSIDESWLDVTGSQKLFGDGRQIADELRRRVREELGLTISVGVSFNKVFAKLGSDYKKPDATTVITRENFREILFPLPVRDMLFVGANAAEQLSRKGIMTIGDLANTPLARLHDILGRMGDMLWAYANGLDDSSVRRAGEEDPVKSISNSITFHRNLVGEEDMKTGLLMLADSVGARMRRQHVEGYTVQVQIKSPELKIISRQETLKTPTASTREIYQAAQAIVRRSWDLNRPVRMLSLGCTNFAEPGAPQQLSLFEEETHEQHDRQARLESAVDAIRSRFGSSSIGFGQVMGSDLDGRPDKKQ